LKISSFFDVIIDVVIYGDLSSEKVYLVHLW
jgi:hypothetical protein